MTTSTHLQLAPFLLAFIHSIGDFEKMKLIHSFVKFDRILSNAHKIKAVLICRRLFTTPILPNFLAVALKDWRVLWRILLCNTCKPFAHQETYPKVLHFSFSSLGFCNNEQRFLFTNLSSKLSQQAVVFCLRPPPQLALQGPQPPLIQTNRLEGFKKSFWIVYLVLEWILTPLWTSFFEATTWNSQNSISKFWHSDKRLWDIWMKTQNTYFVCQLSISTANLFWIPRFSRPESLEIIVFRIWTVLWFAITNWTCRPQL